MPEEEKNFGLQKRHIDFVIDILKNNIPEGIFYIFGSRSKGNNKEYSDIDIAVDNAGNRLSPSILGKILQEFEDSTLPYEVDVIDLNSIEKNFYDLIKDSLVKLEV